MKIKAGDVFEVNEGGSVTVVEYLGCYEVKIEHNDSHKHQAIVKNSHLRAGSVKNPFHPSVHSIGYLGSGEHKVWVGRKVTPTYKAWSDMLKRCYSEKYLAISPTYIGCSVCEEWLDFQSFAEWYLNQTNSGNPGFQIDKDLRRGGNKVYGPDSCSFVPQAINTLLGDGASARGALPQGVRANRKKFEARLKVNGKALSLGTYATPSLAYEIYRKAKVINVKSMAAEWKDYLHPEVYKYLNTWDFP